MSTIEDVIKTGMREAEQNVQDAMRCTVELCAEICDRRANAYAAVRRAAGDDDGLLSVKETTARLLAIEILKLLEGRK